MRKITRAFVLGFAASALAFTGCASTGSTAKDCDMAAGDCDMSEKDCDMASMDGKMSSEKCDMSAKGGEDCGGEAMAGGDAINDTCPISGNPVSADVQTVSFQGQEIGFCCGGCVGKFANLTDAEKAAKLAG